MGLLRAILVISLVCTSLAASQTYNTDLEETSSGSFSGTIAASIVNWVTKSIQYMFELFDIKVRATRFLVSLYNTDNLILVKRLLNMGLRFGGWLYDLIPDSTSEANNMFLSFLFPRIGEDYLQVERKRDVLADAGLDSLRDWPAKGEDSGKDPLGLGDWDTMEDAEQQIVNLNNLLNGRVNLRQ